VLFALTLVSAGCQQPEPPTTVHTLVLTGSPYERGLEHGRRFGPHIRSLYTRLLENSIMPYLNREQMNIAPVLPTYKKPQYRDGMFSYYLLYESGQHLFDHYLPEALKEEMRGISDGSGVGLDKIIILNTFFDTMMAFRGMVLFIQFIQEPYLASLEFQSAGLASDGLDNDGDGETDEADEGLLAEYGAGPQAVMVEVPPDATLRLVFEDPVLAGLACLDPRNVEPLGDRRISAACIDPTCVADEHQGKELLYREWLSEVALECLEPRVAATCLVRSCVENPDPGCVNPETIRLHLGDALYTADDPALQTRFLPEEEPTGDDSGMQGPTGCQGGLEVIFTPPGGLEPAALQSLLVQAGDQSPIHSPEPFHNRFMRDERITFTTAGYHAAQGRGAAPYQIPNRGGASPDAQPPGIAFALRGSATVDGAPLLGTHYALLDSDMVHEHSVLLVHVPDEGPRHAFPTWTGLVWGFTGMNAEGLSYAIGNSDTLDNPLVGAALTEIFKPENLLRLLENPDLEGLSAALADVKMLSSGIPIGMMGRELLRNTATTDEALALTYATGQTFGWNLLVADAAGELAAIELDSATQADRRQPTVQDDDGFQYYTAGTSDPRNLDPHGAHWAAVGEDDLLIASHFRKNSDDMIDLSIMQQFEPRKQRTWSGYYYRSTKVFHDLRDTLAPRYGALDAAGAIEVLRTPALVDQRDSMMAAVLQPSQRILRWAMGAAPASSAPFRAFDLQTLQALESTP